MCDGGISLSLRRLLVLIVLAMVSAAVGAGVALWLGESAPPDEWETAQRAVEQATTKSASAASAEAESAGSRPRRPLQDSPPAKRGEMPQAEGGLTSPLQQPRAIWSSRVRPPLSLRDISPAGQGRSWNRTFAKVSAGGGSEAEPAANAPDELAVALTPITLTVTPSSVRQGETVVLSVNAANGEGTTIATVRNAAGRWPPLSLSSYGDESWAIFGVPRDARVGFYTVTVDLRDEDGRRIRTLSGGLTVRPSEAPLEEIWFEGGLGEVNQAAVQRDHDVRFVEHTGVSGPPLWQGAWLRPVVGEDSGYFGSRRMYNGVMGDQWHHGHDIAADHGDWIIAPARGVVVWSGELALHGLGVILDHGAGVYSGYWHMSEIAVAVGVEVEPGDWLGNIGSTGLSTGPHLHWEVIIQGIDVDPVQWLGGDSPPLPAALSAPETAEEEMEMPTETSTDGG